MRIEELDFDLPEALIARYPADKRDASRLLVLPGKGAPLHRPFWDFPKLLRSGDVLVLNETRVFPARLLGKHPPNYGKVEALLLEPSGTNQWKCLVKPGKKIREGDRIIFATGRLEALVKGYGAPDSGVRILEFQFNEDWWSLLEDIGHTPLPPYILKARKQDRPESFAPEESLDRERYQTVFAGNDRSSVAAPTAGLHFTPEILKSLEENGVELRRVNLHVGAGTFQPIQTQHVEDHPIHGEYFEIPKETSQSLERALVEKRRIIAVGTTVTRALETAALLAEQGERAAVESGLFTRSPKWPGDISGRLPAVKGWTRLMIQPPYEFRALSGLLTNFHLPRSSLLLLVMALAGVGPIRRAYQEAIQEGYRFFSYGDCMFIANPAQVG